MATLAEMLGGIEYPVRANPSSKMQLTDSDEPMLMHGDHPSLMVRLIDLEEGILAQSAIGK